jgi:hypothetical protein
MTVWLNVAKAEPEEVASCGENLCGERQKEVMEEERR